MAKVKQQDTAYQSKPKKSGVAAKTKTSKLKASKNYVKAYKSQGR